MQEAEEKAGDQPEREIIHGSLRRGLRSEPSRLKPAIIMDRYRVARHV